MITIVDYGMGNLRSVQKAFESLGFVARVCAQPDELQPHDKLVLPGVGAFRDAIAELRRQQWVEPILDHLAADRPFLGICLGLQLLLEISHEDGEWPGLGVIPGEVVRFADSPELKVPHMGWNQVRYRTGCPLFAGIPQDSHFYFVHSYHVVPQDPAVVVATTQYGGEFTSAIQRGRMFATQFHPEKSQAVGLQLLRNFASL
ncbi:MAG: imidazole glycerol phosphate synthase subunit HisH [Planctomycetaceae bacterium]|jgi:glutamine amidotransferase